MCGDVEVQMRLYLPPKMPRDPTGMRNCVFLTGQLMLSGMHILWTFLQCRIENGAHVWVILAMSSTPRLELFLWYAFPPDEEMRPAIYGHPRKLQSTSFQYFTFYNWVMFRIPPLSSFCKAAWEMFTPQISSLLFSELYNGLIHGHAAIQNIQTEEDLWLCASRGVYLSSSLWLNWVGREIGTDFRVLPKSITSPFSRLFPPLLPRVSCLGIRKVSCLSCIHARPLVLHQVGGFLNCKTQDSEGCWLRPWCVFEECLLTLCILLCHTHRPSVPVFLGSHLI